MAEIVSGGLVDAIILLVALEAVGLFLWRMKTGRGPAIQSLLSNLLAGAFLLLALRNALTGSSEMWIALCLLAAFISHLLDMRGRWESGNLKAAQLPGQPTINATLSLRVSEQNSRRARRGQMEE